MLRTRCRQRGWYAWCVNKKATRKSPSQLPPGILEADPGTRRGNARVQSAAQKARRPGKKQSKDRYCVRNWREYSTALVARGSLTLWIEETTLANWKEPQPDRASQRGRARRGKRRTYSDEAITCALTLAAVFRLALRAVQGFVGSLFSLLEIRLPVPHYSTLCRRRAKLAVGLEPSPTPAGEPLHVAADATGLKVFGEGEWKVRQHGADKRRTWRKTHLLVETSGPRKGRVRAVKTTQSTVADGDVLPDLLDQTHQQESAAAGIAQVSADGAYDWRSCYEAIAAHGAHALIPPRKDAVIWQPKAGRWQSPQSQPEPLDPLDRDEHLRTIRRIGRRRWKEESGYSRRSLVENAILRFKRLFGEHLSARLLPTQGVEAVLRCRAMNKMTELGMPQSYVVQERQ